MPDELDSVREVLEANEAFYAAFREGSVEGMDEVWAQALPVAVMHPGWSALAGREAVMESWRRIMEGAGVRAIHCRSPRAYVLGDVAYVLCTEELEGGVLGATNLFAKEQGAWRMVHHQAGPGSGLAAPQDEPTSGLLH